jgi:predicted nucleic acid-binding protein/tetratricopeptide (TPR) repeat protein
VLDEFENDAALGPAASESLLREWLVLEADGSVAVILAGLLKYGDVVFLDALRARCLEMLEGLEMLPLGVEATIDRIVDAVRSNFVAAQRDTDDAVQRSTSALLTSQRELGADVTSRLDRIEGKLERPATRVILINAFDENLQRDVAQLKARDEAAAGRLAEILESGGLDSLAATAVDPPNWAQGRSAAFWEAVGTILSGAGRLLEAQRAFEHQEATPGVIDRVEALTAAARVADADGRHDDAQQLRVRAQAINSKHPSIALFDAAHAGMPQERLDQADAVQTTTDPQEARKQNIRAIALLGLGRYEEAKAAADLSTGLNAGGGGRELASLAVILASRENLPFRDCDDRPLVDAVEYQLSLFADLKERRPRFAGVAGARAALGQAVLGDQAAAGETIDAVWALDGGVDEDETRSTLSAAAMAMGDAERAKRIAARLEDGIERQLVEAAAALMAGDDRRVIAAALDELIESLQPGDDRRRAIALRLGAAAEGDVDFDVALVSELEDSGRALADLEASRAAARGDFVGASAAMAAFDDPSALAMRAEFAERGGNLTEAIGLQAALVRQHRTAPTMLRLAALRARAGDFTGAIRDAILLASDDRKLRSARDAAYALAAQAASEASDWVQLDDITDRWSEFNPDREDPKWGRTLALARQGQHRVGLAYARAVGLTPTLDGNRHMLFAELYAMGIPDVPARLRSLIDLSDRFDRPQELEQAFIGAVLTAPSEERSDEEDIKARFQAALLTFEERFPDSGVIHSISVGEDDSGEALIEKLAAVHPGTTQEQAEARQEFIDGVRAGRLPVSMLAAMVGRGTAETILRNGAHPLGDFDQAIHEADIAAADQALGAAGAALDETACITLAELPEEHVRRIRAALPNALLGQVVRGSLVHAASVRPAGEEVAMMQVLPDGSVQIVEQDPELVARVRDVEAKAGQLATELAVHPDKHDDEDRLAELLKSEQRPLAASASALLAARDLKLPLYCDDRVLRGFARNMGIPTFGTVALIDVMQRRSLIDSDQTLQMLNAVVDLGTWGLMLQPDSYVQAAQRAGFSLRRLVRPLLADEALLQHDLRITHNARLLRAVAVAAPGDLDAWADAIMTTYRSLLGIDPHLMAALLVGAQFDPHATTADDVDQQRIQAIVDVLRGRDYVNPDDPRQDPLLGGIRRWLAEAPEAEHEQLFENLLSQLPPETVKYVRQRLEDAANGDGGGEAEEAS